MDWVVIVVGLILFLGLLIGIYRGALRIAVTLVTTLLSIAIAVFAMPYAVDFVVDKTPLDDIIEEDIVGTMEDAIYELALEAAGVEGEESDALEAVPADEELTRDMQIKAIEDSDLPAVFKNLLTTNNNNEIYSELGVESFVEYSGAFLSKMFVQIIVFLGLFLFVTLLIRAIVFALDVVNDIPVFGLLNRLAGGAVGMAASLFVIWFLFVVVTLLYTTDIGKDIYNSIQANGVTKLIYEFNPLLKISIRM